ncbi:MAG TPA: antitoxin Xre-like helix-turn-helix domain-containing protein [Chitinophaga sp.]|uniref:antitoxin Xre-like helix-turn-helix domain-containing protein n=1 Tax=Chitinophaga sp. TaxID=1869181 RepID=UPI002C82016B|nr:antitoxin Xre-like helix-turn-helix domain-containing protein [Chitinophaga sp.]HVI47516.1 antitoxin Xre-like helix-turn-helix domain-containing protein [Chitinophaga sp.]
MTVLKQNDPKSKKPSRGLSVGKLKSSHKTAKANTKSIVTGKKGGTVQVNAPKKVKAEEKVLLVETKQNWGGNAGSLEGKFDYITGLSSIVNKAMKGVDVQIFYTFANTIDIPDRYLAEILNTTARTLSNYKEQGKTLEPVKGEHLLKLIGLFKKGERIFSTLSEFQHWLSKPRMGSVKAPVELLVTPGGIDLVSQELDRIAYGYAF